MHDELSWAGRPVLKESHVDDLEHAAAINEFEHGMPRDEAEKNAYGEYVKNNHTEAAAHHLRGLRAAQASGDFDQARLHGEAYHHHLKKLGHDSLDEVPQQVKDLTEAEDRKPHYKFKSHPSDRLLLL